MVNSSTTVSTLLTPKGATNRSEGSEGRGAKENQSKKNKVKKENQSGVDTQGKWLKKSGKLYYGYKNYIGGIKIERY
ncbi:MAG: hypothetical protein ACMUEL_08735 [Flavobacteriales bacterium Tduv]